MVTYSSVDPPSCGGVSSPAPVSAMGSCPSWRGSGAWSARLAHEGGTALLKVDWSLAGVDHNGLLIHDLAGVQMFKWGPATLTSRGWERPCRETGQSFQGLKKLLIPSGCLPLAHKADPKERPGLSPWPTMIPVPSPSNL